MFAIRPAHDIQNMRRAHLLYSTNTYVHVKGSFITRIIVGRMFAIIKKDVYSILRDVQLPEQTFVERQYRSGLRVSNYKSLVHISVTNAFHTGWCGTQGISGTVYLIMGSFLFRPRLLPSAN